MGADYLLYVKIIETHVRAFLRLIILAIGRVSGDTKTAEKKNRVNQGYLVVLKQKENRIEL